MTPALRYHRAILATARREIAHGKEHFFRFVRELDDEELREDLVAALSHPALTLRPGQVMPEGDWPIWMMRTGRGWGKNHAASCAINELALYVSPGKQGLIVAATHKDALDTIINGESGIMACSAPGQEPRWQALYNRLTWPNGSTAVVRTGDNPQDIRGLTVPWAYADELIKWPNGKVSFQNISNCVREGDHPRIILTSTPLRSQKWLRDVEGYEGTIVTTGGSADNPFLPRSFFQRQRDSLTAVQHQEESLGEWVEGTGRLWTEAEIAAARFPNDVPMSSFLEQADARWISVDPSNGKRDLAGMSLLCARDGITWVVADLTPQTSIRPSLWIAELRGHAERYLRPGDTVLVETNGFQGIDSTIQAALPDHHVVPIFHAGRDSGKIPRAERAQTLYQRGLVRHFRTMSELERQMTEFYDIAGSNDESPDRVDALVTGLNWWADDPLGQPFIMAW